MIDSGKLALLLRGGFLKPVHHTSDNHRTHLKHWINLYHDRVQDAVTALEVNTTGLFALRQSRLR